MRVGIPLATTVVLLVAGCLSTAEDAPRPRPAEPAPPPPWYQGTCDNALLFQFVDNAATDAYLPPGFHPRDPQGFLSMVPVAFGQAGVVALAFECLSPEGEPYRAATVDIFVESPSVPGVEPALFDFYEIERYADPDEFGGALTPARWPRLAGEVEVLPMAGQAQAAGGLAVEASVTDAAGLVMGYQGTVGAPVPVGSGIVRFWHDGPRGLAYYQYDVTLDARVGGGVCQARSGSALAALTPSPLPSTVDYECPPGTPIVATFPGLAINATAGFLPGVRAQ